MSDIVERLHLMTSTHERHEFGVGDYWNVCEESADEIERLRAENASVHELLKAAEEDIARKRKHINFFRAEVASLKGNAMRKEQE